MSHEIPRSLEKDSWRCSVHTGSGRIWSRHGKLLIRTFADVAEVARELPDCVLDGELLAVTAATVPTPPRSWSAWAPWRSRR
ncbi:DNA ligase-like domain-containing protein [Streptomyces rimosus]|uniref:hypothetical protein n=1 Tax=Streptomyces rimosus TaxID=1927 RepID=UPI0018FEE2F3|nr:hypothetical protein [Streptomyces rimosus]